MSDEDWDGSPAWLFLLGLVVFLATVLLFLADLLRGVSILRSVAGNGVGVALLILWAAHDTLRNPDSVVGTPAGAAGTALLLYGLYLLGAGAVIVLTSFFHDQFILGVYYVAIAVAAVLVGYVVFPSEGLAIEQEEGDEPEEKSEEHEEEEGDEENQDGRENDEENRDGEEENGKAGDKGAELTPDDGIDEEG